MEMSAPGASNLYAFENAGLIKDFVIDKRLASARLFALMINKLPIL